MVAKLKAGFLGLLVFFTFYNYEEYCFIPLKPNESFFSQYYRENSSDSIKVLLGQRLFFDSIMSRDYSLSCATCHLPTKAFTDGKAKSVGIRQQQVGRNAPSLANVVDQDSGLHWDRGVPSLEMQVLVPVQEHAEFDFDLRLIAERMKKNVSYLHLSNKAYQIDPNPFVITHAIACFERTLISNQSKFDQYITGDLDALNSSQKKGMKLFFQDLYCSRCHNGKNFSNFSLQNNGLYRLKYPNDSGRMRITYLEQDRDKFKVPSLRNVAITSPYMHHGSIETLEAVIDHYASGGKIHPNKSHFIKAFDINPEEKKNLIDFLKALTDTSFISKKY